MAIPKPKVFWPFTITTANRFIDVQIGATTYNAVIAQATYTTLASLKSAIETALNASGAPGFWTITWPDGISTIANSGNNFTLRWGDGPNAANAARSLLGFFASNVASAGFVAVSPFQHANGWYSPVAAKSDSKDMFESPNSVATVAIGGQVLMIDEPELTTREVAFGYLPPERTFVANEGFSSGINRALERWWRNGRARFRYYPDASDENAVGTGDYSFAPETLSDGFKPNRQFVARELYESGTLKFRKWVP